MELEQELENEWLKRMVEDLMLDNRKLYTDRCVRLAFAEGDAESCGRCRALHGSEFAADNTQRFPLAGCSSPVGCAIEWKNCGAGYEEDEVEPWRVDD